MKNFMNYNFNISNHNLLIMLIMMKLFRDCIIMNANNIINEKNKKINRITEKS